LLSKISSIEATNFALKTPLHLVAKFESLNFMSRLLLNQGAGFSMLDDDGHSPVSLALSSGNFELMADFVRHGLDWTSMVFERQTLAEYCIKMGRVSALSRLLGLIKEPMQLGDLHGIEWQDCFEHVCFFHHLNMVKFLAA
jgi:ankyrin repeat protein